MSWYLRIPMAGLVFATGCASGSEDPPAAEDPASESAPEAAWAPPPDRLGGPIEPAAIDVPAEAAWWTCPMHPEVRQAGPGKCPKCRMDLVPEEGGGDPEHKEHNHK